MCVTKSRGWARGSGRRRRVARALRQPLLASPAVVALLGAGSFMGASAAQAETLEQALISAYMTNPQILAERANLRATDEQVPQALAGYRPQIQVTTNTGREHVSTGPANLVTQPTTTSNQTTVDARLTQPLYNGGGTVAATAAAEDSVIAERANNLAVEETVLFAAITAYYDVMRDMAIIDVDRQYVDSLQQLLTGTRGSFQIGTLTQVDVAQAQGRLESVNAQREVDAGQLEADRGEYEHAVGHLPDALTPPTLKAKVPAGLNDAVNLATTNNPNVVAHKYSERSARDNVAVSQAKLLPSIALVLDRQVQYGVQNGTPFKGLTTNSTSATVQLTFPFYDGGLTWSQSRQDIEKVGQAQGQTDDARRQAVQNARQAWQLITAGRAAIKGYTAAIAADVKAVEGVRQQQLAGERTILDVLTQQQQLFGDQRSLVVAQHDEALAEFNLAMQVGNLSAADLRLEVPVYDVTKHYNSVRNKWVGFGSGQ